MSTLRLMVGMSCVLMVAGCSVPPPVPVPLPSGISGEPSPCEPMALAGFPRQDPPSDKTYYVCKPGVFAANFDPGHLTPQWAVQHITAKDSDPASGPAARLDQNDARPDPDLPEARASSLEDYHDNGYLLSYLVPPTSFPYDDVRYSRAQYLSNAFPLHPDRGAVWESLNEFAMKAAKLRGQVKVISGTIYENGVGRGWVGVADNSGTTNEGKVEVPTSVFKLIVDPSSGEYMAFIVPNSPIKEGDPPAVISDWSTLEKLTGVILAPDAPQSWKLIHARQPVPANWR